MYSNNNKITILKFIYNKTQDKYKKEPAIIISCFLFIIK